MNKFSVKDKVILVTGASSGIGRYFSLFLAKEGAHVILVGRNKERLLDVEKECQKFSAKTLSVIADVSDAKDVNNLVKECQKIFATVDVVVNCAGIASRAPALDLTEEQWDSVMNINTKGTFLVCQAFAKWMIETKTAGKIINISSCATFHATETRVAYTASKLAVESITRGLALNLLPHHISVNCISPGIFLTEINAQHFSSEKGKAELKNIPMQRTGELQELEGVLLLLASSASNYMTGSVICVDGGFAINKA